MTKNIARYFDERIMPLIRSRHRDIVSEASIMMMRFLTWRRCSIFLIPSGSKMGCCK